MRKVPLPMSARTTEFEAVDLVAKENGKSRSEMIDYAVQKCIAEPEVLVNIFRVIMEKGGSSDKSEPKKNTSVLLEPETCDGLEELAGKLEITRNMVLTVMIKGISLSAI